MQIHNSALTDVNSNLTKNINKEVVSRANLSSLNHVSGRNITENQNEEDIKLNRRRRDPQDKSTRPRRKFRFYPVLCG